ncbi:MAG TPA: AbrB/MazE/SpoVT family DNA-binding domain-containing protein [Pirellulales bacterium]|nr:AbrB/MazE/SpoVT family DNA-binding domain-containing protein [Pirellulales bacterium]
MSAIQITALEPGNRIQLPADWVQALGFSSAVSLERTPEGIIVRPARASWDDIFATKLSVRPGDPAAEPDVTELSGDDLLF